MTPRDPAPHLPLKTAWFHILLTLAEGPAHGYAIRERTDARTGGAVTLWPATLYGALRDLEELGAIEALEGEADPDDDQRRRYHALTAFGSALLRAESERLQALLDQVRETRVWGGT